MLIFKPLTDQKCVFTIRQFVCKTGVCGDFFKVLREIYVEHGCDGLVDLGDTTDDRSSIPVPTIDALISKPVGI
jgi:hypothetical protein